MNLDAIAFDDVKRVVNMYVNSGMGRISYLTMGAACAEAAPNEVWTRPDTQVLTD